MTSRHAWLADVMWGLAITATVPFVVGTAFLSAAARPAMAMAAVAAPMATAVAPAGEHDPCIGDPDSAECSEWLAQQVITMHEEIWADVFGAAFHPKRSLLTLDFDENGGSLVWIHVDAWHDARLNYEDPDLEEEIVMEQLLGQGWLETSFYFFPFWSEVQQFIDPDDGVLTTVQESRRVVSGALVDEHQNPDSVRPVAAIVHEVRTTRHTTPEEVTRGGLLVILDAPPTLQDAQDQAGRLEVTLRRYLAEHALPEPLGEQGDPDATGAFKSDCDNPDICGWITDELGRLMRNPDCPYRCLPTLYPCSQWAAFHMPQEFCACYRVEQGSGIPWEQTFEACIRYCERGILERLRECGALPGLIGGGGVVAGGVACAAKCKWWPPKWSVLCWAGCSAVAGGAWIVARMCYRAAICSIWRCRNFHCLPSLRDCLDEILGCSDYAPQGPIGNEDCGS